MVGKAGTAAGKKAKVVGEEGQGRQAVCRQN